MSKGIGISIVIILLSVIGLSYLSRKQTSPSSSLSNNDIPIASVEPSPTPITNVKASFAIFTNGTFRVFTAAMYHNLSQDVYIEASNPNIVHVKKAGITWNDFFSTLPFKVTTQCLTTGTKETFCTGNSGTLKLYLNGEKNSDALSREIKAGDKLLVTFGADSNPKIEQQLNRIP